MNDVVRLLGIVGSPRKGGNTELLVNEVLKAAQQEGAETELIYLEDFSLAPCHGCRTCFETKNCVINDDVEKIFGKIVDADGVIIGSPVYFYNVNAQTKTFIDRVGYLHMARGRKAFKNKVGGAVAVAGSSGTVNALSSILQFLAASGMIIATPLVRAIAPGKGDVLKDTRGMESARELGKSITQIAKATSSLRAM